MLEIIYERIPKFCPKKNGLSVISMSKRQECDMGTRALITRLWAALRLTSRDDLSEIILENKKRRIKY